MNEIFFNIKSVAIAHEFLSELGSGGFSDAERKNCGIIFCISGEGEFRISGVGKILLTEGEMLFLPAGISYTLRPLTPFLHYTVNFEADIQPLIASPFRLKTERFGELTREFSALCRIWEQKEFGYHMRSVGITYKLLADMLSERELGELEKSRDYLRLLPAKRFIESNFTEKFTIGELARLTEMSETNFRRSFGRTFGITPIVYRDRLRLLKAQDMLSVGRYTAAEVALSCGFEDAGYFSRFYKSRTGKTPKGR